jgi:FdrA protein
VTSFVEVRRGAYRDSVSLMQISRRLAAAGGVEAALVAMATALNRDLLEAEGFTVPAEAGPNDLVIAIRSGDPDALEDARSALEQVLAGRPEPGGAAAAGPGRTPAPRTVRAAATRLPGASLAFVSVPGRHAFVEAMDALAAGLHVVVFSDNVPVAQEVLLKAEAQRRGLLVMGPDCGTAVVNGAGLGFANRVRHGPVGIVAASGTGAQQLMCLLDAAGTGISHCLGVGGRDLSAEVGGASTRQALEALDADADTELILVVSKPPAPRVASEIRALAGKLSTPTLFALLGPDGQDLTSAAAAAVARVGGHVDSWPQWRPGRGRAYGPGRGTRPGALRGLYCGGTLCDEAMVIASGALGPIASNIPLKPGWAAGDDLRSPGHLMIDFGDDRLTEGRPHPVIDPSLRLERLAEEVAGGGPPGAVVLIDVILGYAAHPDPAADLVPVIEAAAVPVVATLVGTAGDPQGLDRQAEALRGAGAHVFLSNAAAARHAVSLVEPSGRRA